jgi:hypothetical protein
MVANLTPGAIDSRTCSLCQVISKCTEGTDVTTMTIILTLVYSGRWERKLRWKDPWEGGVFFFGRGYDSTFRIDAADNNASGNTESCLRKRI